MPIGPFSNVTSNTRTLRALGGDLDLLPLGGDDLLCGDADICCCRPRPRPSCPFGVLARGPRDGALTN